MTTESTPRAGSKPVLGATKPWWLKALVCVGVIVPSLALVYAILDSWGWAVSWLDLALLVVFYFISNQGVTTAFHRYFTHGAFKAKRWFRNTLAVWGQMGMQGDVITWVADHRRHHAFSDKDGDPHSPWKYGTSPAAIIKGGWHAHMGWLFNKDVTNAERFAPDLLQDKGICLISKLFIPITVVNLALPAIIGGLVSWSWWGALTALFWGGFVRIGAVHHVTWSVNSICHMFGKHPFKSRDKAGNVGLLAIASGGESYHNLHHADPTSARHGVLPGQIDITARLIWIFEKLGWVYDVRWPSLERLVRLQNKTSASA